MFSTEALLKAFYNTPPLWIQAKDFPFEQYRFKNEISGNNFPEINFPKRLVLGKSMEYIFLYYLQRFSEEEVLANNIQIISEKTTVGELDFLLKNPKNGKISHVELVYKFYLYNPTNEIEMARWIGPNRRDSLPHKINKLKSQQFPLLFRPETTALLNKLNINPQEIIQKVCFKAQLFVPRSLLGKNLPLINNRCICGFWIKSDDFLGNLFGKYTFYLPEKKHWPLAPEKAPQWNSFEEIKQQILPFLEKEKSPLVWLRKNSNEFSKFFIVWW